MLLCFLIIKLNSVKCIFQGEPGTPAYDGRPGNDGEKGDPGVAGVQGMKGDMVSKS